MREGLVNPPSKQEIWEAVGEIKAGGESAILPVIVRLWRCYQL